MVLAVIALASPCFWSVSSFAQKTVIHNDQQWIQYYNQFRISPKWTLFSDASLRRIHHFSNWSQFTLRAGIGYPVSSTVQGVTGFATFMFYAENRLARVEFRPYQDLNISSTQGRLTVQHRFRTEARYFREVSDSRMTEESAFNWRFRYRVYCTVALWYFSRSSPDRCLLLNFGDEVFINAGRQIRYNVLDNNRLLVGPALQLNQKVNLFLTYNFQFGQRNGPALYEHSDVLWAGMIHRLKSRRVV